MEQRKGCLPLGNAMDFFVVTEKSLFVKIGYSVCVLKILTKLASLLQTRRAGSGLPNGVSLQKQELWRMAFCIYQIFILCCFLQVVNIRKNQRELVFFLFNSFREKGTFSKLGLKFGPYSRKRTLHGKTQ